MKITSIQIEQLYTFTRQHYVEYYDLQTELVDHLANGIEQQWIENPALSFDDALHNEFKKFGIFGFSDVVDKRRWELEKKYHRLIWKHFLRFFTTSAVWKPTAMILMFFLVLKTVQFAPAIFTGAILVGTFAVFYLMIFNRKKYREKDRRWLFQEIILSYGGVICFSTVPFQIMLRMTNNALLFENFWLTLGVSLFLVSYGIVNYIIYKVIPDKAQEYLKETYPEYEMSY